jgi:hypothetical protein
MCAGNPRIGRWPRTRRDVTRAAVAANVGGPLRAPVQQPASFVRCGLLTPPQRQRPVGGASGPSTFQEIRCGMDSRLRGNDVSSAERRSNFTPRLALRVVDPPDRTSLRCLGLNATLPRRNRPASPNTILTRLDPTAPAEQSASCGAVSKIMARAEAGLVAARGAPVMCREMHSGMHFQGWRSWRYRLRSAPLPKPSPARRPSDGANRLCVAPHANACFRAFVFTDSQPAPRPA